MSLPTQAQINNLIIKKIQGAPFTDIEQSVNLEAIGSSSNRIISSYIFSQTVPIPAPDKKNSITMTSITMPSGGKKYTSIDPKYPYIVYYENLVLSPVLINRSFYYAGTDKANVIETNLLINAIPFNYDSRNSYAITVTNKDDITHAPIAINSSTSPWYFDGNSG